MRKVEMQIKAIMAAVDAGQYSVSAELGDFELMVVNRSGKLQAWACISSPSFTASPAALQQRLAQLAQVSAVATAVEHELVARAAAMAELGLTDPKN